MLSVLLTGSLAVAQGPVTGKDLSGCAAIEAQAERLACYDRLAGRGATNAPTAPATVPPAPPAPTARTATPAPQMRAAFGLYAAEHPTAPKTTIDTITARVVALKYDASGHEIISLEGGPVWQLAGSDALLANGDSVTIKRAALGSYTMTTPTGRVHRVQRLR